MHSIPNPNSVARMNDLVNRRYDEIGLVIPFDQSWKTPIKLSKAAHQANLRACAMREMGTFSIDYDLRNAVSDKAVAALEPGDCAKSIDPDGRKIIFVGTSLGPVAVYDSSHDPKKPYYIAVASSVLVVAGFSVRTTNLRYMADIIGVTSRTYGDEEHAEYVTFNIGQRLEEIYRMMAYSDYRPNTVRTRRLDEKEARKPIPATA